MKIAALERYSASERAGVLATLALATSPNPYGAVTLDEDQRTILAEIMLKVGAKGDPTSPRTKFMIDEGLTRALSMEVLGGKDVNEILGRAGTAGTLLPSVYDVDTGEAFRNRFAPFHVKDRDLTAVVLRSDDVQHLEIGDDNSVSIFMRWITDEGADPFWGMGYFHRTARVLQSHCYWRIYPSDIDLTKAQEPVDALGAFVDLLGSEFVINGVCSKFFRNVTVPWKNHTVSATLQNPEHILTFSRHKLSDDECRILIGYAISKHKYADYLRRHNVPVKGSFTASPT